MQLNPTSKKGLTTRARAMGNRAADTLATAGAASDATQLQEREQVYALLLRVLHTQQGTQQHLSLIHI